MPIQTYSDFDVTDLVDDVLAALSNKFLTNITRSEYYSSETLSAQKVLTDNDTIFQIFDLSANQDVLLPAEGISNHPFIIFNTNGTYTATVKEDSDTTTIGTVGPNSFKEFIQIQGEGWQLRGGMSFATSAQALTGTATDVAVNPDTLNDIVTRIPLNGMMLNGKISPSVSANDLILAIKTWAGADPSASDPVYVNINGTVRTITAATSMTLADATNWFNLGSAEFATIEQDLFAYAVWDSNSSVVAVSAARKPGGRLVSDFSSTSSSENYLGNYSNFTSTDALCVIGRFAATLSAGAGYTWTVPTYTNLNLILEPIYETRELTWVPQPTNLTVGNGTLTAKYKIKGSELSYTIGLVFGSTSAVSGSVSHTVPFTRASFYSGSNAPSTGLVIYRDTGTGNFGGVTNIVTTTANLLVYNAAGTYLATATLSSTVPHTWANTDEIQIDNVRYSI